MGSNLRLMIFKVLQEEPKSGYGIAKSIEERTGWKPSYGSVYPVLEDMQEKGILSVKEEGRKKIYSLTDEGREKAQSWEDKKEELYDSMEENIQVMGELMDQDVSPLIRLVEQFKEGRDPVAQVSPEIFQFRNKLLEMCIEGLSEDQADEIKKMLRGNIEKLEALR